jgi:hypothetical protein
MAPPTMALREPPGYLQLFSPQASINSTQEQQPADESPRYGSAW